MTDQLLQVENLNISIGEKPVVKNVSFSLNAGEVLCLVGESGSGKSLSALSVIDLLPDVAKVTASEMNFFGQDMRLLNEEGKRKLRGSQISMIFQEPMTALNPVMTVGEQVAEVFEVHTNLSKKEIKEKVVELFHKVKIPEPTRRYNDYPFQMSGGQRQRVMIAMALAMNPKLIIADEPTTALDVTVQKEILKLMVDLQKEFGTSMLFITHDFGVVAEVADKVAVMEQGEVVEQGSVDQILNNPQHPYTQKLLAAMPDLNDAETPEIKNDILLEVKDLSKVFTVKQGGFFGKNIAFHALDNVSFTLKKGETVGVVGESGCGKSTLSRCLIRLYQPESGSILFNGEDTTYFGKKDLKRMRANMQMVFQDPFSSLNPRMKVGDAVGEGLRAHGMIAKGERKAFVKKLLADVGLPEDSYDRYPHQFSGGQRQRIGFARAIAMKPALVIADEAVSALDVSVQAQVLDLMQDLKEKYDLSYLFVSHDLRVVSQIADRVIVMKDGKIVEQGTCSDIFNRPQHNYTKKLLSAIPRDAV